MTHVQILKIPAIGQTFSRGLMPQLSDHLDDFLKFLDDQEIYHYEMPDIDVSKLKSTQANGFDYDKIMSVPQGSHKIIISNDMHVIDGHHRWLAEHNRDGIRLCAHKINLPILDAVAMAKRFIASKELQEGITHKEFQPMVDSFVDFASNELGIKSFPSVKFKQSDDSDEQPSFGGYSPSLKIITISTKNRHPMDIFRTLAHELVHAKQDEDGRLTDVAKEGSTGSDCENEANSQAGVIMRKYAKKERKLFNSLNLDEQFVKMVTEDTPSDREWGTRTLTWKYKKDTPGQDKELEEDGRLTTATGVGLADHPDQDGVGPTTGFTNFGPGGLGSPFSRGYGPYESADKGLLDMGTVPKQGKEEVTEGSPVTLVWKLKKK